RRRLHEPRRPSARAAEAEERAAGGEGEEGAVGVGDADQERPRAASMMRCSGRSLSSPRKRGPNSPVTRVRRMRLSGGSAAWVPAFAGMTMLIGFDTGFPA